jgi:hypothetical protein
VTSPQPRCTLAEANCSKALCLAHTPLPVLLTVRALLVAQRLGSDGECSHQEVREGIDGIEVRFVSTLRYRLTTGSMCAVSGEGPTHAEAVLQLLLTLEALTRSAASGAAA